MRLVTFFVVMLAANMAYADTVVQHIIANPYVLELSTEAKTVNTIELVLDNEDAAATSVAFYANNQFFAGFVYGGNFVYPTSGVEIQQSSIFNIDSFVINLITPVTADLWRAEFTSYCTETPITLYNLDGYYVAPEANGLVLALVGLLSLGIFKKVA